MGFDESFKNISCEYEPVYTWFWNGGITKDGIKKRIDEMLTQGIKAFYILAEPKNFLPERRKTFLEPDYLTDDYIDLLCYAHTYAAEKKMRVWLYNEGGFPSGMATGAVVKKDSSLHVKTVYPEKETVKEGEVYHIKNEHISAFFDGIRVNDGYTFERDGVLTIYSYADTCKINPRYSANQADIADRKTTELFLELTHEKLLNGLGEELMREAGYMFDDEAHMGNWTNGLERAFKDKYGYDIADFMPVITGEKTAENIAEKTARADYIMLCGEIVNENYFKPMKRWLNAHKMKSVGHLDLDNMSDGFIRACYGNTLKLLRSYDIPGIDVIWRQISYPNDGKCCFEGYEFFPLIASSAARQTGTTAALSESFAVYGAQVTPEEMRFVINFQAVRGINVFNFMTMSYEKKGALPFQYRPNFIIENCGFDNLREINSYTSRLCYLMRSGHARINAALYYPYRSISVGGEDGKASKDSFEKIGSELEAKGICFDLVDEDFLLQKGKNVKYDVIYAPYCPYERENVKAELLKYKGEASPVLKCESFVRYRCIEKDDERLYFVTNESGEYKKTVITLFENDNVYEIDLRNGKLYATNGKKTKNGVEIQLSLCRGEGKMFLVTKRVLSALNIKYEKTAEIECKTARIVKRYTIKSGVNAETVDEEVQVGYMPKDFSGEVVYTAYVPKSLEHGNYRLELTEPRYFTKVFVDGQKVSEITMPPYVCDVRLTGGEKIEIFVSTTYANACAVTDYFEKTDKIIIGQYSDRMIKHERNAPAGGFTGKINLYKIKETEVDGEVVA